MIGWPPSATPTRTTFASYASLTAATRLAAQRRLFDLRLGIDQRFDIDTRIEVFEQRVRQPLEVPIGRRHILRHVLVQQRADRLVHDAVNGSGQILRAHDLGALLIYDLALIVRDVIEQQQLLPDIEVVRLDLALRLLDLAGEHAALDDLAFLHSGQLQQPLRALRITEDPHEIVFHRQVEAARTGVALAARTATQLVVDTAGFVPLGADNVQPTGREHLVVPHLPRAAQLLARSVVDRHRAR